MALPGKSVARISKKSEFKYWHEDNHIISMAENNYDNPENKQRLSQLTVPDFFLSWLRA